MKRLSMIAVFLVGALGLAACAAQTQEPRVDDTSRADERPKTVIIYRDGSDADGQSKGQAAAQQDDNSGQGGSNSQDTRARGGGGVIVEDNDSDDVADPDADDSMQRGRQLPSDFPVPVPGEYQVEAVGEAGNETTAVLRVPSGEDAYNYYRQALADAGFRVVDEGRNQAGLFEAELEFSDNTLEGNMDFDSDTLEIDLERY